MVIISYRAMSRSLLWSFLPSLYQNDYDTEKFTDEFDQMHGVKKRCKSCVDKMMKACDNSLKILSDKEVENHLIKKLRDRYSESLGSRLYQVNQIII